MLSSQTSRERLNRAALRNAKATRLARASEGIWLSVKVEPDTSAAAIIAFASSIDTQWKE